MNCGESILRRFRGPLSVLAALGLSAGGAVLAGEKVQFSNPDKGPVLPPKSVEQTGRDRAPFDFFDRGNSVGGVVDAPSATPAAGPGDPRAQRKLLEVLGKQKNWTLQDGGAADPGAEDVSKDADPTDPSWENFEENAAQDDPSGRGRRNSRFGADDSTRADNSPRDRRRGDRDSVARDTSQRNDLRTDRESTASGAKSDPRTRSANDSTPEVAGERVQFSDPFSVTSSPTADAGIHSPFDFGTTRSVATTTAPSAASAVAARQQQFQQLLGSDSPKTGLDGLGLNRTPAERSSEFRALLTGAPDNGGVLGAGSPLDAAKPASSVLAPPKSSLPSALAPLPSASGGFNLPNPVAPAPAPVARPQPAILPFPKRF